MHKNLFLGIAALSSEGRHGKLEAFRLKESSLIKNRKKQCYATTVLFLLLKKEEFRNAICKQLETSSATLAQYVVNAHLGDNKDENWLHKLACLTDPSFADANREHDAGEFLANLLNKLDIW